GVGVELSCAERNVVLGRDTAALSLPAVGGVERPKAADEALRNRAVGLIGRGIPSCVIEHAGYGQPVTVVAAAVAKDRVHLALVVRAGPRPVIVLQLESAEEVARGRADRSRGE